MSRYITNYTDRNQINLLPLSLDEMISDNNPVRVIDIFADSLDFNEMGFRYAEPKANGRKLYNPADMLKLYLYGYFNGIRASRKLETECKCVNANMKVHNYCKVKLHKIVCFFLLDVRYSFCYLLKVNSQGKRQTR